MILDDIIRHKRLELEFLKKTTSRDEMKRRAEETPQPRDFKRALTSLPVNIIAEIKRASPSAGVIKKDFNLLSIAKAYEESSAVAISVLTDKKFFGGDVKFIPKVKAVTSKPVLRKDFIIDEWQLYESRAYGADAVLLIASVLSERELKRFLKLSEELGMQCLVESHSREELEKALAVGAEIIGINNRDLRTFKVSLDTTVRLAKLVPRNKTIVSESGISSAVDIRKLKAAKVSCFIIGTALMKAENLLEKMEELIAP